MRGRADPSNLSIFGYGQSAKTTARPPQVHAPVESERTLWRLLRDRRLEGLKFRRQVPIGRYVADFVCLRHRLIVEADGPFHENSAHDVERDAWLRAEGFRAPGFPNLAIETRPNDVVAAIVGSAKGAAASSARPLIRPALAGHLLPRGEKGTS